MSPKNHGLEMARNHNTGNSPRILVLGSTGRIGQAVIAELEQTPDSHQIVYAPRNRDQVETWRREGKDGQAVLEWRPGRGLHLPPASPRLFDLARRTLGGGPGASIHEGDYHGQGLVDYR